MTGENILNTERLYRICRRCARDVTRGVSPTEYGVELTARLLLGTAAQESGLEWERQRGPNWDGKVGGFSKWQLESGSVGDGLRQMCGSSTLAQNATKFLFCDPHASVRWLVDWSADMVLSMMRINDNDHLGCLFARLHYLRIPIGIPCTLRDQAAYYKKYYNTPLGAATVEQYVDNWERLCAPVVGHLDGWEG